MIKVTMEFATVEEALAGLAKLSPLAAKAVIADGPKPPAEKAATKQIEKAAAAAPSAPAAPAAAPASSPVDYATLQKAVFQLANVNRDEAAAVVATFRVKTFKELPSNLWEAALTAVNAKLAELKVAA